MRQYERSGVTVDQCTECRGLFLDRGELEKLFEAEANWSQKQAPAPQQPSHAPGGAYPPPAPHQPGYAVPSHVPPPPPPAHGYPQAPAPAYGQHQQQHHGYHGHYKHKKRKGFLDDFFG
ncbi:Zn-finger nucleic acid-binding protein [Plantactinospora soyae]|uniref:Zn-finger nucleic acid-binding protein n=2 Tax=Plantactinospora soyae TaxID=1544732 RepID=A0A927M0S3_9ACTN|nr:Zn-finger nucleic acid-binding protein [Plantactinospora soyae]